MYLIEIRYEADCIKLRRSVFSGLQSFVIHRQLNLPFASVSFLTPFSSTLDIVPICSSETSGFLRTTQCYKPEVHTLHS
jgi:hypothetical protein